ncbi:hypothetical protein OG21DRAFT_1607087 [Imleria badia]|nr:hypothetical protein OG21DRAFT_1607087 [Imleria badia]
MTEGSTLVEINCGYPVWVVIFSANGEYLIGGDDKAVRVWRVADGEEVGTMAAYDVRSIAVSKDGKWIAAGTELGRVTAWDAQTHERLFTHKESSSSVRAVDFAPDSNRLVTASSNCTASIWDLAARKQVLGPLHHEHGVVSAKYSPQGDRIATCTDSGSIRVYDSRSGRLFIDIPLNVAIYCNFGLTWSNDAQNIFVVADGKIKQIQVSTGSAVKEWPVHSYKSSACITLSKRGEFIVYSSNRTVNFLDTSTDKVVQVIKHDRDINSIALSPDDRFLATITEDRKITIRPLQETAILTSLSGPFIHVGGAVLDSWRQGRLVETETLLTEDIDSENPSHRALAHRALIRTHLQQWNAANDDAAKSIKIQPSVIGLIAKSVALVGGGKKQEGFRACDLAFKHCHSERVDILLAIKAVVVCLAGEYADAISRVGDLIATTHDNSIYHTLQARTPRHALITVAYMRLLFGNSRLERKDYEGAIQLFERAQTQIQDHESRRLWTISLISGWQFDELEITIQRQLCETLYATGRAKQAEDALLKMVNSHTHITEPITAWISDFIQRCLSTAESSGDATSEADQQEQAMTSHTSMSSLGPSTPTLLLAEWTRIKLTTGSWRDILVSAVGFRVPRIMVYQATCERLEMADRLVDAIDCFHHMVDELAIQTQHEVAKWSLDFRHRCSRKVEDLGDAATNTCRHDEAISRYSAALTLDPTIPQDLLVKRSKAYAAKGLWQDALNDANEAIKLDPSSPLGYERKHAALRGAGRHSDAIDAFETMLSLQSSKPDIYDHFHQYVKPEETKAMIRKTVQDTIRDLPRVLVNTASGRLLDKSEQASMFESSSGFMALVSSMTTNIDTAQIKHEVAQYYRYATFSHTWEENEPLFEKAIHIVVYDLEKSFTHDKLQMLCKIVRDAGFNWAWSDTCCINKHDHGVLQEALVAMFKWYQGSALMIVFLRGVRSPSKRGDLARSIWNSRAWTFQEYYAAKVVRFYTEDWKPYMNLDIPNHKESPEIISEMEEATGISAGALRVLRPGPNGIREKLFLASRRKATFVEDAAYSLIGIFAISLPIIYGEGDKALGRLLAHLLASSGDTSILAWTGKSGSFNSCLPADIAVFNQLPTSHIPTSFKETITDTVTTRLPPSSHILVLATRLYDRLNDLAAPSLSGKRIKIPCIIFSLGHPRRASKNVFRVKADAVGIVEIRTTEDLSQLDSVYLIHPWIDFLLDRQAVEGGKGTLAENMRNGSLLCGLSSFPGASNTALIGQRTPTTVVARLMLSLGARLTKPIHDSASLSSPLLVSLTDKRTQVLQFIARLSQPFGALLFTPTSHNAAEYRRVATDSMITAQIQKDTPLNDLISNVRMLDVL